MRWLVLCVVLLGEMGAGVHKVAAINAAVTGHSLQAEEEVKRISEGKHTSASSSRWADGLLMLVLRRVCAIILAAGNIMCVVCNKSVSP